MAGALAPGDRERLVKLLGLLGSDFAGERAAAALKAAKLVKAAGLGWDDLLATGTAREASRSPHAAPHSYNPGTGPNADLALCLRHLRRLTAWEEALVVGLTTALRWSPKQRASLQEVAGRLRHWGCT